MPIKPCFEGIKIGKVDLGAEYKKRIKDDMSPHEQRMEGAKLVEEHINELNDRLNKIKEKAKVEKEPKKNIVKEKEAAEAKEKQDKEKADAEEKAKQEEQKKKEASESGDVKKIKDAVELSWTSFNIKHPELTKQDYLDLKDRHKEVGYDKLLDDSKINVSGSENSIPQYIEKAKAIFHSLYPEGDFRAYERGSDYEEKEGRPRLSGGYWDRGANGIALNLEAIKKLGEANNIYHEVIHPIVAEAIGSGSQEMKDAYSEIVRLKNEPELRKIWEHEDLYRGRGTDVVREEAVTEFITHVVDGKIDASKLSKGLSTRVIELVNKIFKAIGIKKQFSTASDIRVLSDAIKKAFDTADTSELKELLGRRKEIKGGESMDVLLKEKEDKLKDLIKSRKDTTKEEWIDILNEHGGVFNKDFTKDDFSELYDSVNEPHKPPVEKTGAAEGDDGVYKTQITKESQIEIDKVRKAYEEQGIQTWDSTMQNGLAKVKKNFPDSTLLEGAKQLLGHIQSGIGTGDLDSTETTAVMQYLKHEMGEAIHGLKDKAENGTEFERKAADFQADYLSDIYDNASLAIKKVGSEAARTLNYLRSELWFNKNRGLELTRRELRRANKGEPLTKEQEAFAKDINDKKIKIAEQEVAAKEKSNSEAAIAKLDKAKLDIEGGEKSPNRPKSKSVNFKRSGKDIADRIRKLKMGGGGMKVDFTAGTWDLAVEGVAKLVEGVATVADAIDTLVKEGKIGFRTQGDREAFEGRLNHSINAGDLREGSEEKIKELSGEKGGGITKEMVSSGAIDDFVNSHIGEHDTKDIISEATKSLSKILPDVTEESLKEAYTKRGEFKEPSKAEIEGSVANVKKSLRNMIKLEGDIKSLEETGALPEQAEKSGRPISEHEKELLDKKQSALDKLKEERKKEKESQNRADKIAELDANIERAKNDMDIIKTHRNKSPEKIDEEISKKKRQLKDAIGDNTSDERIQQKKLEAAKKRAESDIKTKEQQLKNLEEGGKDRPKKAPVMLTKSDAELIRLNRERALLDAKIEQRVKEERDKNKSKIARGLDFARAVFVNYLIGKPSTLVKIMWMGVARPTAELLTKSTFGKAFEAFFPSYKEAARRAGESSSLKSRVAYFNAFLRHYSAEDLAKMSEESEKKYFEAEKKYNDYAKSDSPDQKKLKELEKDMNEKSVLSMGNLVYEFIGGSSRNAMWDALLHRASKIDEMYGHEYREKWGGSELDKTRYVMDFIGRSHKALKTPSARASFAAGFMARLEYAVDHGIDISTPDKIIELANESYINWEQGAYQQDNYITNLWNRMMGSVKAGDAKNPQWKKFDKWFEFKSRTDVAVNRVPVNIIYEMVSEYGFGSIRSIIQMARENKKANAAVNELGIMVDSPEFKDAFKKQIEQIDPHVASSIARNFRKGFFGLALYGLGGGLMIAKFGGFPFRGQGKKKEEEELKDGELNKGDIVIGGHKFGEVAAKALEHTPAMWPLLAGTGWAYMVSDRKKHGDSDMQANYKALLNTTRSIEGQIPVFSALGSPTKWLEDRVKTTTSVGKSMARELGYGEAPKEALSLEPRTEYDPTKGIKIYNKENPEKDRIASKEEFNTFQNKKVEIFEGLVAGLKNNGKITYKDKDDKEVEESLVVDSHGSLKFVKTDSNEYDKDKEVKISEIGSENTKKLHTMLSQKADSRAKRIVFNRNGESAEK